jgi:hypothetical protein
VELLEGAVVDDRVVGDLLGRGEVLPSAWRLVDSLFSSSWKAS